jgi:hypothetical protein
MHGQAELFEVEPALRLLAGQRCRIDRRPWWFLVVANSNGLVGSFRLTRRELAIDHHGRAGAGKAHHQQGERPNFHSYPQHGLQHSFRQVGHARRDNAGR